MQLSIKYAKMQNRQGLRFKRSFMKKGLTVNKPSVIQYLTSVTPPERLCASSVFHNAEEAGEAVGETTQNRAVPGGGRASPSRASSSTDGSLLETPEAPIPGGGRPVQSGGGT